MSSSSPERQTQTHRETQRKTETDRDYGDRQRLTKTGEVGGALEAGEDGEAGEAGALRMNSLGML